LTTLDILLGNRFAGKCLFVKIDVEGAEREVLLGAVKTLDMLPPPLWLVEICLDEHHPGGPNPHYVETFEMFWRRGYETYAVDTDLSLLRPEEVRRWAEKGSRESPIINYLFAPREHPVTRV
jgi:methyltransferase FkbM-like protein